MILKWLKFDLSFSFSLHFVFSFSFSESSTSRTSSPPSLLDKNTRRGTRHLEHWDPNNTWHRSEVGTSTRRLNFLVKERIKIWEFLSLFLTSSDLRHQRSLVITTFRIPRTSLSDKDFKVWRSAESSEPSTFPLIIEEGTLQQWFQFPPVFNHLHHLKSSFDGKISLRYQEMSRNSKSLWINQSFVL